MLMEYTVSYLWGLGCLLLCNNLCVLMCPIQVSMLGGANNQSAKYHAFYIIEMLVVAVPVAVQVVPEVATTAMMVAVAAVMVVISVEFWYW